MLPHWDGLQVHISAAFVTLGSQTQCPTSVPRQNIAYGYELRVNMHTTHEDPVAEGKERGPWLCVFLAIYEAEDE